MNRTVSRGKLEEAPAPGYAVVRAFVRLLVAVFYRRIDVHGVENLPVRGGLVVAANHHNSVVDAMLLIGFMPRPLRMLANAPLFVHPLIGPFLRLLGALPVHRRQEAGNDPARNAALFEATTAALRAGGGIAIFPEGRTQPEPVLLELRSGTARMVLAAEEESENASVTLLPVGLLYKSPGTFREGEALMMIGAPIATEDAVALARVDPGRAACLLTERLATAIRGLTVEAGDRQTLRALGLVEQLLRHEGAVVPEDPAGSVAWMQQAMATYRQLARRDPDRVQDLRRRIEEHAVETARAGLDPASPAQTASTAGMGGRLLLQSVVLLLEAPFALVGLALHIVPYRLTGFVVRVAGRTDEEEATDKMAVGLFLYPMTWALQAWAAFRFGGWWLVGCLLLALVPTAALSLDWRERLLRLSRDSRTFIGCRRDPQLRERLLARRRCLADELRTLAAQVSEESA